MTADAFSWAEALRLGLAGSLTGAGLAAALAGALGQLRFPDFYARMHAASVSHGLGVTCILGGLAVAAFDGQMALRLAVLWVTISICGPAGVQALAGAAHAGGLDPLVGRYEAPRPGDASRGRP